MPRQFNESGIRFQYPDNWRLEREETEAGWNVSLQSPGTAFLLLCLREDLPTPAEMADSALDALRQDYPDLEAEDCVDSLCGQPAIGHNVQFFSLDLTNTCWTRSFYGPTGTVLLLCQTTDLEMEQHEPVLKAICASLKLEEEE